MKKKNWIYTSIAVFLISFLVSLLLINNWKISLILGIIAGVITQINNPIRRYMKAFWVLLSFLISLNSFTLQLASNFKTSILKGHGKYEIGKTSIILTVLLALLCILLLILDYLERNKILLNKKSRKFDKKKSLNQKAGKKSKQYMSNGDMTINK